MDIRAGNYYCSTDQEPIVYIEDQYSEGSLLSSTIVATTCQNSTCSLLTSAKLSVGYLVVGITRELDKEPSLY